MTNLGSFFWKVCATVFKRLICILISTRAEWKASKRTGQYECSPKRALGGILNSWTAAAEVLKIACNSDLLKIYQT